MIRNKKSILLFLIIEIIGIAICCFAFNNVKINIFKIIFLAIAFCLMTAVALMIGKMDQVSRNNKLILLIINHCNPKEFLENYKKDIIITKGKSRINSTFKTTYSLGLIASGDYEKAIEILSSSILEEKNDKDKKINRVIYNYLCSAYGNLGDVENGLKYLTLLKEINQDIKPNKMVSNEFEGIIEFYEHFLSENDINDDIQYFENYYETKQLTNYNKVLIKNKLGYLYYHNGEKEKYIDCLDYVERHGRGLFVAKNAREKLLELKEQ